ncbi:HAMP domain-containing histidine kinase [Paenibacillus alvei]|uniref:sensor histidine kinase n=1 Tax=Paenibacillus alvei TaxID=44250 RepID=UPI000289066B|nr:HAMP domain-containing sensor histidine kinase [Paenibacillus alvei]EJW15738.1 alkaline phosphatase synthesis sensor protein PhoR [Paenibacillus alvei DSM 29]MCY9542977.1 HAMP domain-containing histidine kinase [Paenibacillus alvei]MCY9706287.1 HAMP domain-containing histidine kinase [Paenibacillus alvei]MCY9734272.1 HAMP domain-containing histidine kinase [Paenibacillus alvei]MCY9757523.1 HAMP domain-containing histidine kinase [Paenibacillus alvei]
MEGNNSLIKPGIRRSVVMHYFIVVFMTMLMLEVVFLISVRTYYYDSVSSNLTNHASVTTRYYQQYINLSSSENDQGLLPELLELFKLRGAEVQILDRTGKVLISSSGFRVDKPIGTLDVLSAQQSKIEHWIGKQPGTGESIMAVSAPLFERGNISYIVRLVTSLEVVNSQLNSIVLVSILVSITILIIVLVISLGLANSIVKPINEITAVSAHMARGRFDVRAKDGYKYELGELSKTLNFMAQEIVRSNQLKNDFVSSISHELRTPLTGIKGWSETLLSGSFDQEETKLGLNVIHKETDRLIGLVEELLDFSKLQENKLQFHWRQVSIATIIEDTILQVKMKAEKKQIRLEERVRGNEQMLNADPNRLKQVFLNLIDNAVKFSPEESVITIHTSWDAEKVVVRIVDQGIGISEEHLTKVMDKFYQVNPSHGGTGLGLAITYELVKAHGGEMSIESEPGVGTTVIVSLPIRMPIETEQSMDS